MSLVIALFKRHQAWKRPPRHGVVESSWRDPFGTEADSYYPEFEENALYFAQLYAFECWESWEHVGYFVFASTGHGQAYPHFPEPKPVVTR